MERLQAFMKYGTIAHPKWEANAMVPTASTSTLTVKAKPANLRAKRMTPETLLAN
jgi:hypothetical protein